MKKAKVGMRFQRVISLVGPVLMSSGLLVMSLPAAALDQPSLASSAKSTKSQYTAPVVEVAEDHPAQVLSRHTAVSTSDVDVSTDDDFSDGVSGIATTHAVATASDKVISTSSANKSQQSTSPKKDIAIFLFCALITAIVIFFDRILFQWFNSKGYNVNAIAKTS